MNELNNVELSAQMVFNHFNNNAPKKYSKSTFKNKHNLSPFSFAIQKQLLEWFFEEVTHYIIKTYDYQKKTFLNKPDFLHSRAKFKVQLITPKIAYPKDKVYEEIKKFFLQKQLFELDYEITRYADISHENLTLIDKFKNFIGYAQQKHQLDMILDINKDWLANFFELGAIISENEEQLVKSTTHNPKKDL